ncbi:MAG: zinc ribbon domain-containing protein [Acetatifactor sp.]|nr:zinc ribbon domain-containing protein [Acetatifactor sp.]
MALIKCPECGREISDKVTKCSYCGTNIEEIESYNKKDKLGAVIKKVGLVIVILILLFICISVVSSHLKMKTFEGYVDEFIHHWDRMVEASRKDPVDFLTMDIYERALCTDMRSISESYVEFDDKTKVNDYLERHTYKDMFEYVMELIIEDGREYSINKEFIEFYTNMK